MKYNLFTFPRHHSDEVKNWLMKFKAELRETLKEIESDPYKWYCDHNGAEGLIAEILGEV